VASGRYPLPLPLPIALFVLFAVQFVAGITLPTDAKRLLVVVLSGVYPLLALAQLLLHRRHLLRTIRDGSVSRYDELEEADRVTAGQ
jgi:cation:H+ antiporter